MPSRARVPARAREDQQRIARREGRTRRCQRRCRRAEIERPDRDTRTGCPSSGPDPSAPTPTQMHRSSPQNQSRPRNERPAHDVDEPHRLTTKLENAPASSASATTVSSSRTPGVTPDDGSWFTKSPNDEGPRRPKNTRTERRRGHKNGLLQSRRQPAEPGEHPLPLVGEHIQATGSSSLSAAERRGPPEVGEVLGLVDDDRRRTACRRAASHRGRPSARAARPPRSRCRPPCPVGAPHSTPRLWNVPTYAGRSLRGKVATRRCSQAARPRE